MNKLDRLRRLPTATKSHCTRVPVARVTLVETIWHLYGPQHAFVYSLIESYVSIYELETLTLVPRPTLSAILTALVSEEFIVKHTVLNGSYCKSPVPHLARENRSAIARASKAASGRATAK